MVLAERQLDRARINERLAESRAAVGLATPLDARQAASRWVGLRSPWTMPARESGAPASPPPMDGRDQKTGRSSPRPPPLPFRPPLDRTALLNDALRAAPALETLRAGLGVAQRRVASAQASYLPSLQVSAGWSGFTRQARDEAFLLGQLETPAAAQKAQCEFQNELFRRLANPLPLAGLHWVCAHPGPERPGAGRQSAVPF
jgi:hypothetical protein